MAARRSRSARAAALLDVAPLRALLARLPLWRGVLVLNYHRVGAAAEPWDRSLWSATAEGFDAQLAFLARNADVVGPQELPSLVAAGRGRHVLLTFDDGYRDNHAIAFPLLRRHGLSATFFVATGFLDRPHVAWWDEIAWMVHRAQRPSVAGGEWLPAEVPLAGQDSYAAAATLVQAYKALPAHRAAAYLDHLAAETGSGRCGPAEAEAMWMTWEMVRELRDGGMAIGGHTVSHPILARLPAAAQEQEVAGCAQRMRDELGEPMRWFSYPVGSRDAFTTDTRASLRAHGVELAFSFYGGVARFAAWDPLDVPRVHVGPAIDPQRLQAMQRVPALFARPD